LRAFIDDAYLWYKEVPNLDPKNYPTPVDYFDVLKTPVNLPSGQPKDPSSFHFTYPTDYWENLQQSVEASYGITWALVQSRPPRRPRLILAGEVAPGSPAAAAGITRGAEITAVDGVDFVNSPTVDVINAGLFPTNVNESHTFGVLDLGASTPRTVTLTTANVA